MPIYMGFFDKPNVLNRTLRGDVTAQGYEGWIELQSAQLGKTRPVSGDKRAAAPTVSEITVTKVQDSASAALYRESNSGNGKMVVIAFLRDDTAYMTIVLRETMISSYSISGHGGASDAKPMESLTLNFTGITFNAHNASPNLGIWSTQQGQVDMLGP